MAFMDKLKSFLGLNRSSTEYPESSRQYSESHSHHSSFWPPNEGPPRDNGVFDQNQGSFNVFTDPLEMQRYFEEQMNNVLRTFEAFGFGSSFGDFGSHFERSHPALEDGTNGGNLRDQYLKPGYENPPALEDKKGDKDLDNKLDMGDLDSIFRGRQSMPQPRVFGQSVTSKTIMKPDGSVEIHKTIRDNQGNEETTITHKKGDQEYTIIKRRDKDGKEEVVENLVNIDENDVPKMLQDPKHSQSDNGFSWPLFDRFFK